MGSDLRSYLHHVWAKLPKHQPDEKKSKADMQGREEGGKDRRREDERKEGERKEGREEYKMQGS